MKIATKSGAGLYYGALTTLEDIGLKNATIIGITNGYWSTATSMFSTFLNRDMDTIYLMSDTPQTITTVIIIIAYL